MPSSLPAVLGISMPSRKKALFDVEFAADLMSVSKQTVVSWIDSGRLHPVAKDANGNPLFDWAAFTSFPQASDMDEAKWKKFTEINNHKILKCRNNRQLFRNKCRSLNK